MDEETLREMRLAQKLSTLDHLVLAVGSATKDIKNMRKRGLDVSHRILNLYDSLHGILTMDRALKEKGAESQSLDADNFHEQSELFLKTLGDTMKIIKGG